MKLKSKLITLITSFCFVLTTCLFSVFAVKTFNFNIGGSIEFVAPGVEATVSAATLDGISKKSGSGTMSTFTTTRGMSASDIASLSGVQSWSGIALLFDDDSEGQATIKFTITNNSDKNTENIMVKLSTSTTASSPIQATPSADFCIAPKANHEFTISLFVANQDVSAKLDDFAITVELKAIKTSEILPAETENQQGTVKLSFSTNSSSKTASFTGCTGSSTVEVPAVVKDADGNVYTVTEIPDGTSSPFDSVQYPLKSITLPSTLIKIGAYAFYGCSALSGTFVIPNSVISIGSNAFYACTGLTGDLIIPNSVKTVGDTIVFGCGFKNLIIGNGITTIDDYAFEGCSYSSLTIMATTPPSLGGINSFYGIVCNIYVPASSVDAYKTAQYWSEYADRITAIV